MKIETITTKEIISEWKTLMRQYSEIDYVDYLKKKWVSIDSILDEIERQIESGNMDGVGGKKAFSAAIFLSDLKKALEERKKDEL